MKSRIKSVHLAVLLLPCMVPISYLQVRSQDNSRQIISYEDYTEGFIEPDDAYLATLEEWQNIIEQWLEKPICINNEEADWLVEYKIISLYQLNKLKEYRLIYSNLLSVHELEFIDGWDIQTARKVIPLVTVSLPKKSRIYKKFTFRSFRQSLLVKTSFISEKSKGYLNHNSDDISKTGPYYSGSPARLALRYDLEYRDRFTFGFRMEKDPGETYLVPANAIFSGLKTPDLLSGYLVIKRIGPIRSVILGNYRVSFGYGVNLGGGLAGIKGRNGMSGMADRISPQTSVSETGFFRGTAIRAESGRFSLVVFASHHLLDGTSVLTDSISGNPVSFSSIDKSGLHRSDSELSGRKTITEKVAGGFLVYRNNWLKAGIIGTYNQFDANVIKNSRPYARFGLSGKDNLIAGFSATIWLPKIQFLTETSVSRNKSMAILAGAQLTPVPGALLAITFRKFEVGYQNWYGSGFSSSGRNSDETGIQFKIRIELPKKYLVEILADDYHSQWISYDLASPSRQREIKIMAEKAWPQSRSLNFTFRYSNSNVKNPANSYWVCHPESIDRFRLRLEGRIEAIEGIRLKSRLECNYMKNSPPGWLIFQDIEFAPERIKAKFWLRACFFDVMDYDSRIYAYENDVLYDFSSFMHYGKGLRGVMMIKYSPSGWIDFWIRFSTIYYTNKNIGSGWDEIEGNRQNEIEIQARLKWPG